jgi:hypothetical protein
LIFAKQANKHGGLANPLARSTNKTCAGRLGGLDNCDWQSFVADSPTEFSVIDDHTGDGSSCTVDGFFSSTSSMREEGKKKWEWNGAGTHLACGKSPSM